MLHDAFSGRPAAHAFASSLAGEGGSGDAAAEQLRAPTVTEIGNRTMIDGDDSRLVVAYNDVVRAASEVPMEWSKVRSQTATDRANIMTWFMTSPHQIHPKFVICILHLMLFTRVYIYVRRRNGTWVFCRHLSHDTSDAASFPRSSTYNVCVRSNGNLQPGSSPFIAICPPRASMQL